MKVNLYLPNILQGPAFIVKSEPGFCIYLWQ